MGDFGHINFKPLYKQFASVFESFSLIKILFNNSVNIALFLSYFSANKNTSPKKTIFIEIVFSGLVLCIFFLVVFLDFFLFFFCFLFCFQFCFFHFHYLFDCFLLYFFFVLFNDIFFQCSRVKRTRKLITFRCL